MKILPYDEIDKLLFKELGICGCGLPEEVVKLYILLLKNESKFFERRKEKGRDYQEDLRKYNRNLNRILRCKYAVKYALFYILDEAGLMEHGTSIPGWVTEKGESFIKSKREILQYLNRGCEDENE